MRLMIAMSALAVLTLGGQSLAAGSVHTGPWIDAQGKCRQANGQMATMTVCKPPAATAASATAPKCTTGKVCGKTCIPKTAVCHKP